MNLSLKETKQQINIHKVAILIFFLAFVLRLWMAPLEAINSDEHFWHQRTLRYHHAITQVKLANTLTAAHPGATVTFGSTISSRSFRVIYRLFDRSFDYTDYPYSTETFDKIHFSFQFPIMLLSSFSIAFAYFALRKLINKEFALIAGGFLLTDILFLAHSRLVQMDALQASFITISIFSALLYNHTQQKRYLYLTGVALGLNGMTRIFGLALAPILVIIVNLNHLEKVIKTRKINKEQTRTLISSTVILAGITILVSILLLPALITNFSETMLAFKGALITEGYKGAKDGMAFFFGKKYLGGEPKIYYLFSYLFRAHMLSTIFLPVTLILLLKRKLETKHRKLIITLLLLALFWVVLLSLPMKKEDRYILPTHLLLDIVASYGLYWLVKTTLQHKFTSVFVPCVIALSMVISVWGLGYQYLGYFNPLFGGSKVAVNYIQVGWGEGLRDVAYYLNNLDDAENIAVASWHEGALAPYCECNVYPSYAWNDTDVSYIVFYMDQIQRGEEKGMTEKYFKEEKIVFTSYLNGTPYAWLVKK